MKNFKILLVISALFFSGVSQAFEADTGFTFSGFAKKSASDLRVVWWNILTGGKLGEYLEKQEGHNPLQLNLDELTSPSQKPEFLVLGEYRPDDVKPEIDHLLKSRYKHAIYFPYNSVYQQEGDLVLSDLDMTPFTQSIGWDDPSATPEANTAYRAHWYQIYPQSKTDYDRTFISIRYQWNGKVHYLLPFHSIQPWMPLKATFPASVAKYLTVLEILTGTTNPLYHEYEQYLSVLKNNFNLETNQVLMIGDLNTPDEIVGMTSSCYRLLTSTLTDAFKLGSDYTFPAPSSVHTLWSPGSQTIEQIRIDHALVSKSVTVREAIRVPLRGSDHFPIAVTIAN